MTSTNQIFNQAELALAAYADLTISTLNGQEAALKNAGFATRQFQEFATRYSVVTQYTDPTTSFTATVFKDPAGNLMLALRGTLEGRDYVTNGDIALAGTGYDQLVSMVNWWQRASNPNGQSVTQYQLITYIGGLDPVPPAGAMLLYQSGSTTTYLEPAASAQATGELLAAVGADADHRLDVTGHSLGGHLAMAFGSLFPAAGRYGSHPTYQLDFHQRH